MVPLSQLPGDAMGGEPAGTSTSRFDGDGSHRQG
jgi:hypothetical protein